MNNAKLDALVCNKVMGYGDRVKITASGRAIIDDAYPVAVPAYSADPAAAFAVVEEMQQKFPTIRLHYSNSLWSFIVMPRSVAATSGSPLESFHAMDKSPFVAISLAALMALTGRSEESIREECE